MGGARPSGPRGRDEPRGRMRPCTPPRSSWARPGPTRATPRLWVEAFEAASRAEALLPAWPGQRPTFATASARCWKRSLGNATMPTCERRDRRMIERLAEIHNDLGVHLDGERADAEYAAAFRNYGVDIDALDPAQAGRLLAREPGCDRAGECP